MPDDQEPREKCETPDCYREPCDSESGLCLQCKCAGWNLPYPDDDCT